MILDRREQEATSLVTARVKAVLTFIQPFHFHELRAFSKRRIDLSFIQNGTNLCSHRPTRTLRYTGAEPIAESAMDFSQVLHTAGAGGLASLRLLAPVVCKKRVSFPSAYPADPRTARSKREKLRTLSDLSRRIAAVAAGALLDVESALSCISRRETISH